MDFDSLEERQVIRQDRYDERAFGGLVETCPKLAAAAAGERGNAVQDIWADLFKARPEKLDPCPPHLGLQREILEQAEQASEWQELRKRTKLDEFAAAIGTMSVSEHLEIPKEISQADREVRDMVNSVRRRAAYLEALEDAAGAKPDKRAARRLDKARKLLAVHEKVAGNAVARLEAAMQQHGADIRLNLRAAAKQAARDIEEAAQWGEGFGTEPGSLRRTDLRTAMNLAGRIRNSPKLKAIAEKAGRFVRTAIHKQATKTKHGVDEVVDIEMGADLGRVLPSELALLSDPETEDLFFKKFCEGELLQYRMEGKEREDRGPIIICIDNSGSMEGERELWAKAFSLGLLTIAAKQGRTFAIVGFSDHAGGQTFKKPVDKNLLLSTLEKFAGGGTNFDAALSVARSIIEGDAALNKADIVFVTDGQSAVNNLDEFLAFKKAHGVSCYTIGIEMDGDEVVKRFSDEVIHLSSLVEDGAAMDLYGRV